MVALTDLSLEHRVLGPYCSTRKLGAGGFAPVWLADELHDGRKLREVAVKLFLPPTNEGSNADVAAVVRDQIIEEARSLSRVEHPTVVRFYSLQQDAATGLIGLVMEYIPGRSIADRMEREGPLDEKATVEVATSVAWALAAVHDAGLVHRDIKPANVVELSIDCPKTRPYRLVMGLFATTWRQAALVLHQRHCSNQVFPPQGRSTDSASFYRKAARSMGLVRKSALVAGLLALDIRGEPAPPVSYTHRALRTSCTAH